MGTVLNVKVGSRISFRTSDGTDREAEVVEFPKVIRVKTADGVMHDIRPEDVITEEPGAAPIGRVQRRIGPRM